MPSLSRTHTLVLTGMSIALMAVGAFITIPFGPVPFTLQTLMMGIVVCILPPRFAVAAVGGYLLLGCFGLPVFSGFRGGIGVLAGPTGGFLVGFLLAAVLIAFLRSRSFITSRDNESRQLQMRRILRAVDVGSLLLLALVYYALGCAWFALSTGSSIEATLAVCVVPFIIPDIVKSAVAFVCIQAIRTALRYQTVSA